MANDVRPSELGTHDQPDFAAKPPSERHATADEVYSVFTVTEKKLIILTGLLAGFFSPLSSSIYMPALNTISSDLHVSSAKINLSVTIYLIVQGVAPMMIAGFSDSAGRRLAYVICFTIYIAANLGLALQNNYAALMVLRCLQSGGSSGTVALANGVVGDLVTSSEFQGFETLSLVIGGLLSQTLGWHCVFWFLLIFARAFFLPLLFFFPETCRKVVGDGSVPPPTLSIGATQALQDSISQSSVYVGSRCWVQETQQYLTDFPIEKAGLQVALPLFYIGAVSVIAYGWVMNYKVNLAGPIILLFLMGYSLTAAYQVLNILMVDIYPEKPATATAASNIVRCELGAVASAVIVPMSDAMGRGWAYTLLALIFIGYSPALVVVITYGMRWRKAKLEKMETHAQEKEKKEMQKQQDLEKRMEGGKAEGGKMEGGGAHSRATKEKD
ncbi:major facilitator superfamily domain-containing protein [Lipomyces starkeyi]|uniref:Major facilitator superfamily (MFS) profile domain-containing protein n=1 Tax=Lipomyces starkeyi NRRL Y-11557 TaxID=675824 RepID=A0A1E3Q8J7_LIPST|nr:hypothetical protein LIPSTDRAFT_3191 [Lipomyces starkeyi NRRL Y-11557]